MYRAVVVAKAHKEWQEAKEMKKDPSTISSLRKRYVALGRIRRSPKVNRIQEAAARDLQASVNGGVPASFDDVLNVAHHLRRNIVILNLDMQNSKPRNVQFQTRSIKDYGWQTTLLLYLEVSMVFHIKKLRCVCVCVYVCVCGVWVCVMVRFVDILFVRVHISLARYCCCGGFFIQEIQ